MKSVSEPHDHLTLAIGLALVNAFMLGVMSLCAKLLGGYMGPIEVTFFRNIFSFAALALWIIYARKLYQLHTRRPFAHIFRAVLGTSGIVIGMLTLSLMPLAEATVLLFTSPLFTLVLSIVFLKERVGPYRIGAVIIGFFGVVVVANPFGDGLQIPLMGLISGLAWGFFSGGVDACLRWMGDTEKSSTTVFYFTLFGTLATALYLPFSELDIVALPTKALLIVCGLGGSGLCALLVKTQSLRLGKASIISPIMFTMIIWAVLFDYLFWAKIPTLNVIIGATIIIASNLFIVYREQRQQLKYNH